MHKIKKEKIIITSKMDILNVILILMIYMNLLIKIYVRLRN
jgi:hypothetical protein